LRAAGLSVAKSNLFGTAKRYGKLAGVEFAVSLKPGNIERLSRLFAGYVLQRTAIEFRCP
jgi:hypothetical protein